MTAATLPAPPAAGQPWIRSRGFDTLFILLPPLLAAAALLLWRGRLEGTTELPPWAWVALILCVDVAHVYATLFRTYFDSGERAAHPLRYFLVPVFCWLGGVLLYLAGPLVFWSALAYLAVFHFVRQQYGFMRIYSRGGGAASRRIDALAIYAATLYPLLWWHLHLPRNFNWFVSGDFRALPWAWIGPAAFAAYLGALGLYAVKELREWRLGRGCNLPKNGLLAGTALAWYLGIVGSNGDFAFTLTNVISHGIPYIALVFILARPRLAAQRRGWLAALPVFIAMLLLFAFLEEGLWDGFIWRDHPDLFRGFAQLPRLDRPLWLALVVPLLALPQSAHYVLDGFIWRVQDALPDGARRAAA